MRSCCLRSQANSLAFEQVFQTALKKRGIPQKLYVDNGKIYHSQQLQLICARLGIALCHAQPYQPEAKGKIERFFRTIREQCFSRLQEDDLSSWEALGQAFAGFLQVYHDRPHSALDGQTPMARFLADQEQLRFLPAEKIEAAFLHELERRVGKDATISLDRTIFETPQAFVGERIRVLFRPDDPTKAWVKQADGSLVPIAPVRAVDNGQIPRRKREEPIDYSLLLKEGV